MRNLLRLTVLGLVLLVAYGGAQGDWMEWLGESIECGGPEDVNPGEPIRLNGTEIPPSTEPVTEVWYAWTFINSSSSSTYQIQNVSDGLDITQPHDGAYLNFSAPADAGCYTALLTVMYNRTVEDANREGGNLYEECISYACWQVCVNESSCPLCDDISCWEVAPNCTAGCTPEAQDCPACMCFENYTSGLTVWYNVTEYDTGSDVSGAQYQSDSNGCACIDWQGDTFENETYVITMYVYGPDGAESYNCSGNVSIVETPTVEITRIPNPT